MCFLHLQQLHCHSERSEESLRIAIGLKILRRFAPQNDMYLTVNSTSATTPTISPDNLNPHNLCKLHCLHGAYL